ncbi:MAG: M23 family metallopeptidase [Firmicutes bacterium]|nr:M23 family metallopeptidase [Bacillota bacterium]
MKVCRSFTILIVDRGGRAPLHFSITTKTLYVVAMFMVVALSSITFMVHSNRRLSVQVQRLPVVEAENTQLFADMSRLESELVMLSSQMAELDKLGEQVRGLTADVLPEVVSRSSLERTAVDEINNTAETLTYLREQVPQKAEELETLLVDVELYKVTMAATPSIVPVQGRITSPFGWRRSPFSGQQLFHNGIDIGAPYGTRIIATAAGTVVKASYQRGYGNLVIINHGTYVTHYAHMRSFNVKAGDQVEKGQQIGAVGSTGNSTGPHLHYEVFKDGSRIDPQLTY